MTAGHRATPPSRAGRLGSNGIGTAGFVTGLLGLVLFWVPIVGLVLGLLGVVLGGVGISQGRRRGAPTGLAVGGVVLGALAIVLFLVVAVMLVPASSSSVPA
jgi:hypothetical protein